MPMTAVYAASEPTLAAIRELKGPVIIEFGTPWCGHCSAAQPLLATALNDDASTRHIKIEDGSGRPLGRAFRVKLWPTLIFLRDGHEVARLVRPADAALISDALGRINSVK